MQTHQRRETRVPARQAKSKDVLGEFVIADDDAPVFDPLKEVLDQMALAIAGLAERDGVFRFRRGGMREAIPRLASHLRATSLS